MTTTPDTTVVDFWFDPVCPHSWTASRWPQQIETRRPLQLRHQVMRLYPLNERHTDITAAYRQVMHTSRGPARIATAAAVRIGEEVLGGFYTAFGELVFDRWRLTGPLLLAGYPQSFELKRIQTRPPVFA